MSINENKEALAQLFKALGNCNRLTLLEKLASCCVPGTVWEREESQVTSVGVVSQGLDIAPSTASRYLKELMRAGFIRTERRGQKVACWIAPETLNELADYFNGLAGVQPDSTKERRPMNAKEDIRQAVRTKYRDRAINSGDSSCGSSCCSSSLKNHQKIADILGYSQEEIDNAPQGANLGLGCGNPQAIAALQPGEVVLDLGCGGGFDCFLAARKVGSQGRVIGVDMTPEMISRARENAAKSDFDNVEFRLGEIEHLPVADAGVDVIISNCVINLAPDKEAVYKDAFRALKPGGRLAISDVVATSPLPQALRDDPELWSSCLGGAGLKADLEQIMARLGFIEVEILPQEGSREFIRNWLPGLELEKYVVSAQIQAKKPSN